MYRVCLSVALGGLDSPIGKLARGQDHYVKPVLLGTFSVLTMFGVGRACDGHGPSPKCRTRCYGMSNTEERIATQVGKSAASANTVERELATSDQLPQELTEFGRTTARLYQLSQDL
jgi:hypothetical protein